MHLKKHVMYICLGLLILGLIYFLALSDIFHPKQVASYENFTEISEEYDATEEINEATEIYAKSADTARIVKGTPGTDKKVIYLTFNGMESRGNMEGILKVMLQHGFHGTFFVEGANAAHEEKVTQKLVDEDQLTSVLFSPCSVRSASPEPLPRFSRPSSCPQRYCSLR